MTVFGFRRERLALRRAFLAATAIAAASSAAPAQSFDGPAFRRGMWHFERVIERNPATDAGSVLMRREMTRCVDPTLAMRATFSSPDVGTCHSAKPQKIGNQYIFPMRCDYMGPVRTEITVESDTAYTEVNALSVGDRPRTDTVVARRVGDCGKDD